MRRALIGFAVLAAGLSAGPAKAGLYNSKEARPPLPFPKVAFYLQELRTVPPGKKPVSNQFRDSVMRQTEYLEEQLRLNRLSMMERAELGACYVRLGLIGEARSVLEAGDKTNFFIQANLATAYFVGGENRKGEKVLPDLDLAVRQQVKALSAWSRPLRGEWAGLRPEQLAWMRRIEVLYLRLLQSRKSGAGGEGLDPLFPEVKFVDPTRRYLPGELPPRIADKLPPDALNLVWELCLCAPGDLRLLWLLAEVLNASGQVEAACALMDDIANQQVAGGFKGLVQHRQVLRRARDAIKPWREPKNLTLFLSGLSPRGLPTMPGVGPMAQEVGAMAPVVLVPWLSGEWAPPATPQPTSAVGGFTWRHITIGFVSGMLVSALVGLQWSEWRRRRQARLAPTPPEPENVAPPPEPAAQPDTFQSANPETFRPAGPG
jgi:hypothetical protein